jgi:DNA-binding CsgD family transcriptional regulator
MRDYALTVLEIGLGHHQAALPHALRVYHDDLYVGCFVLPELVESAARAGDHEAAAAALDRLARRASASGTPWALGLLARSQALMADDDQAEGRYLEAVSQLSACQARPDLARAHLLYGEWLRRGRRRGRRRAEARAQLHLALDLFAGRARAELSALGERLSDGQDPAAERPRESLTAQEDRIARLVAEGASDSDAAAELFLSPSTIDYHLRKVFRKLGLTSRTQLIRELGDLPET